MEERAIIVYWANPGEQAEPFIAKFGRSPGLSCAVIKGVLNRTNLEEFRTGLVKPGGTFTVKP